MLDYSSVSITILCVSAVIVFVTFYYLFVLAAEVFKKKRRFKGNGLKGFIGLIMSLGLMGGIAYCLYHIPDTLLTGVSWNYIEKFGPGYLINAAICLSIVIAVLYLYFILSHYFVKLNDKPVFMIIVLSIVSGFGNSIVIFTINQALNLFLSDENRRAAIENRLYLYFLLGIALFTFCAIIVRKKLIMLTSEIIFEKRLEIIDKILKSSYFKFSSLEDGSAYAALNNDPEVIGNFVNSFVTGFTGIITLIICIIYLGTLNLSGMLFSILVIAVAIILFIGASKKAEKLFERNRDYQNIFFKNINDLVAGFKELFINNKKRREFREDINYNCKVYKDTRIQGEYRFVNISIVGENLYFGILGLVVFTFPLLFIDLQGSTLRNFLVVLLYMGGIINQGVFFIIPNFIRVMVSWKRINRFIEDVSLKEDSLQESFQTKMAFHEAASSEKIKQHEPTLVIKFNQVRFQYKNEDGDRFSVGPLDCEFKSGESIFIMGGNGSGKTTLAKLLTGLYEPDEGKITVNGKKVDSRTLANYFAAVYSDFHLFDRLYGIDYANQQEEIQKHLNTLGIADKVQINDGAFRTLKLSTGQRKRLALFISYLEDRPAYLFDEWAADQDPEFREFFYQTLIPELKARGKAVIAITHDDRYFGAADKIIKMELGRIVSG